MYVPLRKWVINVRASYFDETQEQIRGLWNALHYKKVGVIYPDDAFGSAVLQGVQTALKSDGSEPIRLVCQADRRKLGKRSIRSGRPILMRWLWEVPPTRWLQYCD